MRTARILEILEGTLTQAQRRNNSPEIDVVWLAEIHRSLGTQCSEEKHELFDEAISARRQLLHYYRQIRGPNRYQKADKVLAHEHFIEQ